MSRPMGLSRTSHAAGASLILGASAPGVGCRQAFGAQLQTRRRLTRVSLRICSTVAVAALAVFVALSASKLARELTAFGLDPTAAPAAAAISAGANVRSGDDNVPGRSQQFRVPSEAMQRAESTPATRLRRRDAAALGGAVSSLLVPILAGRFPEEAALAEINKFIAEARKAAAEDKQKPSLFNPEMYKVQTQNYNATELQTFLPTLYLAKRSFNTILSQINNPKVNMTEPKTYKLLREQNRLEPIKLMRRDCFKTKIWLNENSGSQARLANSAYERLKRALDDEDTQCLLLSRVEGRVDKTAAKVTRRNVEAVLDGLDQLLELVPEDEQKLAEEVSNGITVPIVKLPVADKYKKAEANASAIIDVGATPSAPAPAPASAPAPAVPAAPSMSESAPAKADVAGAAGNSQ